MFRLGCRDSNPNLLIQSQLSCQLDDTPLTNAILPYSAARAKSAGWWSGAQRLLAEAGSRGLEARAFITPTAASVAQSDGLAQDVRQLRSGQLDRIGFHAASLVRFGDNFGEVGWGDAIGSQPRNR